MERRPELIVMLTHNDRTVENAPEIFEQCRDSRAKFWGIKEEGIPSAQMKALCRRMKECGKTTVLEVVAYTERECLCGAKMAFECGVDILMGTVFFDSVSEFCRGNRMKYMPFVGKIMGRPSILDGTVDGMLREAAACLEKGVNGIDLLGYRYTGDASALIRDFTARANMPVCVAGSVTGFEQLDELIAASPWAFTIGGAFFENKFGRGFCEQIDTVCEYIETANNK